jgi:hypothetical protein
LEKLMSHECAPGDRTEFPVMNAEETTIAVESELTVDRMASRLDRLEPRAVDFAG